MTLRAVQNLAPSFKYLGSDTFANITANWPAASYSGYQAVCSDLGSSGTMLVSNGTRWRPLTGFAVLAVGTAMGPYTNSETIALQTKIPAAFLNTGDIVRMRTAVTKSGTTDSANLTARVGTAGTTGDTAITGMSAVTVLGASGRAGGFDWELQVAAATSVLKVGLAGAGSYTGGGSTAASAATTVSNVSNALWFSMAALSSSTNDTVSVQSARIELLTA